MLNTKTDVDKFLLDLNIKMSVEPRDCTKFQEIQGKKLISEYKVRLHKRGKRTTYFNYWEDVNEYIEGKAPTIYDVIKNMQKNPIDQDVFIFAKNNNYKLENCWDFDNVVAAHKRINKEYSKVRDLFDKDIQVLKQIGY